MERGGEPSPFFRSGDGSVQQGPSGPRRCHVYAPFGSKGGVGLDIALWKGGRGRCHGQGKWLRVARPRASIGEALVSRGIAASGPGAAEPETDGGASQCGGRAGSRDWGPLPRPSAGRVVCRGHVTSPAVRPHLLG
ncbi:uncharacterized protein [Macaca fascicularis]|uniref:uncharacterized protein n=1 Tax=Macaca fascicularis TaxID=9541 RepID=UPI0032B04D01